MISTLIAGKLLSRPVETAGDYQRASARIIAALDKHDREVWTIFAHNATVRAKIMSLAIGEHLCAAGVPRVAYRDGEISRTLFVERVLSLLPQGEGSANE